MTGKPRAHWKRTANGDWIALIAGVNAEVNKPSGPLGFAHWSVRAGDKRGGSGGTSSISQSKYAALNEAWRFAAFLRKQKYAELA